MTSVESIDVIPVLVPRGAREEGELLPDIPVVAVKLRTTDGIEGIGVTLALNADGRFFRTLTGAVQELAEAVVGLDPRRPERILREMLFPDFPPQWFGPGGLINIAASAIDIACWDVASQAAGLPLWRMLGGLDQQVEVYDSGSLLTQDIDQLQMAAKRSVDLGYRSLKMRGGPESMGVAALVARVAAVREVIGDETRLMYDVNSRWTPAFAIRMGRELEHLDLAWIEDPVDALDVQGHVSVAQALDTPVCAGESEYSIAGLRHLVEVGAVDVVMLDVFRLAGVTQARKVGPLCEAFGKPFGTHLLTYIDAHLVAASPAGAVVEGVRWFDALFRDVPEIQGGRLSMSETPGLGIHFDDELLARCRVDT